MSDRPKLILSDKVFEALTGAGLFRADERIAHVVIDLRAGEVAVMHVRRFGDERLLEVVETLAGIQIRNGGDS